MVRKKNNTKDEELQLVKLTTIKDEYELNLLKSILEDNNIPFIVKDYGTGGYMRMITGSSLDRTDILVEKSMFENAKSILDEFNLGK